MLYSTNPQSRSNSASLPEYGAKNTAPNKNIDVSKYFKKTDETDSTQIIMKYYKDGEIDYKGLAEELFKLGDAKLAVKVLLILSGVGYGTYTNSSYLSREESMFSRLLRLMIFQRKGNLKSAFKGAEIFEKIINDDNYYDVIKFLVKIKNESEKIWKDVKGKDIFDLPPGRSDIYVRTSDDKRVAGLIFGASELLRKLTSIENSRGWPVVRKYIDTKTGEIDYKGLAEELVKSGNAKLAAEVMIFLARAERVKIDRQVGCWYLQDSIGDVKIDKVNWENGVVKLVSYINDLEFLKKVREEIKKIDKALATYYGIFPWKGVLYYW